MAHQQPPEPATARQQPPELATAHQTQLLVHTARTWPTRLTQESTQTLTALAMSVLEPTARLVLQVTLEPTLVIPLVRTPALPAASRTPRTQDHTTRTFSTRLILVSILTLMAAVTDTEPTLEVSSARQARTLLLDQELRRTLLVLTTPIC